MGTSQSSLAKSSSKDANEKEKTKGVRGHEMNSEIDSLNSIEVIDNFYDDVIDESTDESDVEEEFEDEYDGEFINPIK